MTAADLRTEYFAEINIGTINAIDATEHIPAGGAFGGDALVYTGHIMAHRAGQFSQAENDAFSGLFD